MKAHTEKVDMGQIYDEFNEYETLRWFNQDDDHLKLYDAIYKHLSEPDRRILLLYAHYHSLRQTAKILGVSASTVENRIKEIRRKIKTEINDN